MELTFTDGAKQRLARYLSPDKKMVLDFDDGVGPFSAVGDCGLEVNYKLVFVDKDVDLPDFDAQMTSNLGKIYYKGYTKPQFADKMEVRFNPRNFTMPMVSRLATLTDNLEVLDLGSVAKTATTMKGTHDC